VSCLSVAFSTTSHRRPWLPMCPLAPFTSILLLLQVGSPHPDPTLSTTTQQSPRSHPSRTPRRLFNHLRLIPIRPIGLRMTPGRRTPINAAGKMILSTVPPHNDA
jgi:hypothetical protein